jgi:hypothetical protein
METNLTNTKNSGSISQAEAEKLLDRIKEIMAETGEPFGPCVNIYIKETYGKPIENN